MIVWNGKDTDAFLKILESIERGWETEVSTEDGTTKTVSTFADVRGLLHPAGQALR